MKEAQDREQLGVRPEWTLGQLAERYVKKLRSERPADLYSMELRIQKLLGTGLSKPPFHFDPGMLVHKITPSMLQEYREGRLGEGKANATVNHELKTLSRMLKLADEVWRVRVPDMKVDLLPTQSRTRHLEPVEETRLLAELDPRREMVGQPPYGKRGAGVQRKLDDQFDFVVMALDTGLRYGEISSLLKSQVVMAEVGDKTMMAIRVWRKKVGNYDTLMASDRLTAVLHRRLGALPDGIDYLFPGFTTGGEWTNEPRGHATKGIRQAMERAGLNTPALVERFGKMTVHGCRHTYASKLVSSGVTLYEVQSILGHSSPSTTMRYAHMTVSAASLKAVRLLNAKA